MERVAISIVLNAEKHLRHQMRVIPNIVDRWIVVEGASKSTFCTSWCKAMPTEYHNNGFSVDQTSYLLESLEKTDKRLTYIRPNGLWDGKVAMFNAALDLIKNPCFLWEIDIDEYWTEDSMSGAEDILNNLNANIGLFACDYLLSDNIIVRGDWGESTTHGYRRLWKYSPGSRFTSHEPPVLENTSTAVPPYLMPRFKHLSYYYESDVIFKSKWYTLHEKIHEGWKDITNGNIKLPCNVSQLFKREVPPDWANTIITYR
jgi:hypothetical protein